MSWAVALAGWALAGWALAAVLFARLRRRLSLAADAEHELRGATTAIALAVERLPATSSARLLSLQVERMRAGLGDLRAALRPRELECRDGELDGGRLAQVLGNLIANAAEHGVGDVEVRSARETDSLRVEIRNRNRPRELERLAPGRGRGLRIAARAARELGGRVRVDSRNGETVATVELPASEGPAASGPATGDPPASDLTRAA